MVLRTVPDLTGLLKHAGHVLEIRLTAALAGVGLTPRMVCVLGYAAEAERTQIQLAELAYLDKTTMVSTVDALERLWYAERRPSATDRRARIIAVTPAGAKAAAEGQRIVDQVHAEALRALGADRGKTFAAELAKLVDEHLTILVEVQPVRRQRSRQS